MSTQRDSVEHRRQMIGARRKNNIYGEVTDHIVMGALELGCDAAFYNPSETVACPVTLYARTEGALYAIKVLYQMSADEKPGGMDMGILANLTSAAGAIGAVPVYAISKPYCRRISFYGVGGKKLSRFE